MSVDVLRPRSRDPDGERDASLRLPVLLVLLRPLSRLPHDRPDTPLPMTRTAVLRIHPVVYWVGGIRGFFDSV